MGISSDKPISLYKINILTTENGLPQNSVSAITQTPDGYIWIGSDSGVVRYDGIKFDVYTRYNTRNLPDDIIQDFEVDSKENLWVATRLGGIVCYSRGEFRKGYSHKDGLLSNNVLSIVKSMYGFLWIGTTGGLNRLENGKISEVQLQDPSQTIISNALVETPDGTVWQGTSNGLVELKKTGNAFHAVKTWMPGYSITAVEMDSKGNLWLGTTVKGIIRFSKKEYFVYNTSNGLVNNQVWNLYADREDKIWIGTRGGGLQCFSYGNFDKLDTLNGLSHLYISAIFMDREGNAWIGTNGGGIDILSDTKFVTYYKKHGFFYDQNFGVFQDRRGDIWMGTFGYGVNCIRNGLFSRSLSTRDGLPSDFIVTIGEDTEGNLWFGTLGAGVTCMKGDRFVTYTTKNGLINNYIYSVFCDRKGTLWVGTDEGGLHRFDKGRFTLVHRSSGKLREIRDDANGNIWTGSTTGGLARHSKEGKTDIFNTLSGFSNDDITFIHEDKEGRILVGTFGAGVIVYNNGKFTSVGKKNGLPHDIIFSILEDDSDRYWLSSLAGIAYLEKKDLNEFLKGNRQTIRCKVFDKSDGLKTLECDGGSQPAAIKARDGKLYFITSMGVASIDPVQFKPNPVPPLVVIKKIMTSRKFHSPFKPLTFVYGKETVEIHFAGLSFMVPEKVLYKYKLEGFDENWIDAGTNRTAFYSIIPPGTYTFRVIACNNDNIWNEKGATVQISIIPQYWQTWWFQLIGVCFALGIIWLVLYIRTSQLKRRQRSLEELVAVRTRGLANKTEELEKINSIVKTINEKINHCDILESILKEAATIEGVDLAAALVYDKSQGAYKVKATIGYGLEKEVFSSVQFSFAEAEERYILGSKEIYENVFIVENIESRPGKEKVEKIGIPKSMLVIKIPMEDTAAGYLLFENMTEENAFVTHDIRLLIKLRDHIGSAFIKSKLLLDLQAGREAAEAANYSKSMFLARMSHEIRTPMNSVIGFADMLMDTKLDDEQKEFTQNITKCGEALLDLIDEILDFSKIEAGQLSFQPIEFDPEVLIFDLCRLMQPRVEHKSVDILCRIGDNIPAFVKSDPGRFRQVLVNLMGNAVKFTHEGEIELKMVAEEETGQRIKLHVSVRDTGIGIAADQLPHVFELFHQADGSITRKYGGTGLGLAISRQIALMMNGNVWAESEEGKGSIFHFTAWVDKVDKASHKKITPQILLNKKALLIDDNPTNLDILAHITESEGMRTVKVTDSTLVLETILEALHSGDPFDVCILDIQMPGLSGFDIIKLIRKHENPQISTLRVLAFSSSTDRQAKIFRELGFDAFLPKPVQKYKLINLLKHLMGEKDAENEERRKKQILVTQHSIAEETKHSVHILLVEDNPLNQKLANFMLTKAGYLLDVANNGVEAVEMVSAKPDLFDLIFMDINMPEMDGIEATKQIRNNGFTNIPIIAMTADALKEDQEKCLNAGMNDYISKPIKRELVFNMVKKWILKEEKN